MTLDPLKIPAFMRKKPFAKRDNSNFYKAPEELSEPAQHAPNRIRRPLVSPAPLFTPTKPRRTSPRAVSQLSFDEPFEPIPDSRRTRIEPAPMPFAPRTAKVAKPEPVFTPVGKVTHFLDKISVAIVQLEAEVRVGDRLVLNGEQGPFRQKLKSMQINRQNVEMAGRGDDIGIKVSKKALVGETIYVIG